MAKVLGSTTAKYRWFAIFYLVCMFAALPLIFITLSLAGSIYVVVLVSIIGAVIILVAILTLIQRKAPQVLPVWLRDWKWMPLPMRSLRPYDKLVSQMPCCRSESKEDSEDDDDDSYSGKSNVDGDFVFLTGNKIPPPTDYNQTPRAIITRIVPTRVIRNISNGDYPLKSGSNNGSNGYTNPASEAESKSDNSTTAPQNGVGNGFNHSSTKAATDSQSTLTPMQNGQGLGNGETRNGTLISDNSNALSSNTLPVPSSFEESLSQTQTQNESSAGEENISRSNGNPQGTYTNSSESFVV